MAIKRGRVELGQAVNFVDARVDAIGDGDVDKTVIGSEGHSGFCTLLGKRI